MYSPTHVQVIVHSADNLLIKGKTGTNNAFVEIELGKESYRTSIKEKSSKFITWNEECELKIPKIGNTAAVVLTAYHRNSLGLDQFLGTVKVPLVSFEKFQRIIEWYKLQGKPGKEKGKDKNRGQLEVEIGFISKSQSQSLTSLQSKGRLSFERLTGSLFGLRQSDRKIGMKRLKNTFGVLGKKKKVLENSDILEDESQINNNSALSKNFNNLDPGVVSDDEDNASHKSSESLTNSSDNPNVLVNTPTPPLKPRSIFTQNPQISISHWEDDDKTKLSSFLNVSQESMSSAGSRRLSPKHSPNRRLTNRRLSSSCVDISFISSPKPEKKFSSSFNLEKSQAETHKRLSKLAKKLKSFHSIDKKEVRRTVVGAEAGVKTGEDTIIPKSEFKNKNKDELISMVVDLQKRVNCVSVRVKDLEDYLDEILVKVMDTVPKILEKS